MRRDIEQDLIRWKNETSLTPLLVRGARQVGKSYIIEKFGREHFKNFILVNFEQYPEYKKAFQTLEPKKIVALIELLSNQSIVPQETLLFLDEIQECNQAIMSLRYFKEQMPELHVIGAGSLLEFALASPDLRMPVGRVQSLFLRPLSFGEFLDALGFEKLRLFLKNIQLQSVIDETVHSVLIEKVKEYCALGGMPFALNDYLSSKSFLRSQEIQTDILWTYRKDFGKYAKRANNTLLELLFSKLPGFIGEWIKYSKLSEDFDLRSIKSALKNLNDAGLINMVYATSASGLPLISHMHEKKVKALFLDIGLVKRACHLDVELIMKEQLSLVNAGMLAEQYVGQELLAYSRKEENNSLFFWIREAQNSSAEVDFIIAVDQHIVPIEVKAGSIGSLKSLKIFLEEKNVPLGIRISEKAFGLTNNILSVPFYLIEMIPNLVRQFYQTAL